MDDPSPTHSARGAAEEPETQAVGSTAGSVENYSADGREAEESQVDADAVEAGAAAQDSGDAQSTQEQPSDDVEDKAEASPVAASEADQDTVATSGSVPHADRDAAPLEAAPMDGGDAADNVQVAAATDEESVHADDGETAAPTAHPGGSDLPSDDDSVVALPAEAPKAEDALANSPVHDGESAFPPADGSAPQASTQIAAAADTPEHTAPATDTANADGSQRVLTESEPQLQPPPAALHKPGTAPAAGRKMPVGERPGTAPAVIQFSTTFKTKSGRVLTPTDMSASVNRLYNPNANRGDAAAAALLAYRSQSSAGKKKIGVEEVSDMVGRLSAQRKDHTGPAKAHVKPVKLKCKFDEKGRLIEVYEALPAKPREERTDFMRELYTRCEEGRIKKRALLAKKYLKPLCKPKLYGPEDKAAQQAVLEKMYKGESTRQP